MSSSNDVVVTGLGATTPLGGDVASTWDGLISGRSGVAKIQADWAERFDLPVRIAAQLAQEPTERLERVQARKMDRCEQVALIAAHEAWDDAGLPQEPATQIDPERLGVVVGTGIGGALTLLSQDDNLEHFGLRKVSPLTIPMLMPNGPAAWVGLSFRAEGGVHAPVSACASGAEALAMAWRMLRAGEVDVVIAGGAEACICPLPLAGFAQMRAMSTRNDDPAGASRPFDVERDGFVLGEGAGMMVLERASFARARGARVYGRLAGIGTSSDGHHITAPDPEGTGAARAIKSALRTAGIDPADVGHVNAHATATSVGDVAEASAIRSAIGDHAVVTAPKSSMGHLLGAAGAVEAIATLLAIRDGVVPPTLNLDNIDPAVQLDVATDARKVELTAAVNDSFGFGGHNVALAFTAA
jgi:3-oxoacyl-[acyl-carrier-protein] synthase II